MVYRDNIPKIASICKKYRVCKLVLFGFCVYMSVEKVGDINLICYGSFGALPKIKSVFLGDSAFGLI